MNAIAYHFRFPNGRVERVGLTFDAAMLLQEHAERPWTRLDVGRCPHCPLSASDGHCPFATGLAVFAERFDDLYSYERVEVAVVTEQRTVMAERALQHGLASLVGLVGATCGCPRLAFFRPMARLHLPFACETETLVRAFSLHLLGEWIQGRPLGIDDLAEDYHAAALVNRAMADRLRSVCARDAVVNALITLDTFAQAVPYVMEDKLGEFAGIFDSV